MDKEDVVYIYIHTHTHTHTQWNLTVCDNMDEPRGYYVSEISQTEKGKHHDFTYMLTLRKQMNKHNKMETD